MERSIMEWLLEEQNPAFKAGDVGAENKWVTLYAYMAQE